MEHCINVHESMHNYAPYIYTCKLIRIWLMMCQLNVQSYCFCHVLMIFTGKKHTFQLNTIEVYERERILSIIWFYHEKLTGMKTNFWWRLFTFFLHLKSCGTPRRVFSTLSSGCFHVDCNTKSFSTFNFQLCIDIWQDRKNIEKKNFFDIIHHIHVHV